MNATVMLQSVDIQIPGYRILRPIGEGGMASVFLAVQESLDREVALKVMSPALAANREFAERFVKEGRITAKLQHPNLVTVYDIGSHNGVYYLAAEFIPGGTTKERQAKGDLSVGEILDIISDVAYGLDFAHQKGFVHRDVKPANVMFRKDGRVVLADFGIAKAMDGSGGSTTAGMSVGTPDYMSPEQARGEAVDGRSDIYSLGVMLFELLTGHPPYQAPDPFAVALAHVTQPVPSLPEPHGWLQPLINASMAKLPAERYNSGAAFAEAIQRIVATAPAGALDSASERRRPQGQAAATAQRTRVAVQKDEDSRDWKRWGLGGAAVAVVALLLWAPWRADVSSPEGTPASLPPLVPTQTVATPTDAGNSATFVPSEAPIAADVEQLENWLTQAEVQLTEGVANRGVGLSGREDAALELFQRVLQANPGHPRALAGIEGVARFYRSAAAKTCDAGVWSSCRMFAENGLLALPDDTELQALLRRAQAGERGG